MENSTSTSPSPEEIALRAYEIYIREGCPEGKHEEHWSQAETELRHAQSPVSDTVVEFLRSAP